MWEKIEITKLCNKLFMKVNLPVEFNREKYDLNYKCHIDKIETFYKHLHIYANIYTVPD